MRWSQCSEAAEARRVSAIAAHWCLNSTLPSASSLLVLSPPNHKKCSCTHFPPWNLATTRTTSGLSGTFLCVGPHAELNWGLMDVNFHYSFSQEFLLLLYKYMDAKKYTGSGLAQATGSCKRVCWRKGKGQGLRTPTLSELKAQKQTVKHMYIFKFLSEFLVQAIFILFWRFGLERNPLCT